MTIMIQETRRAREEFVLFYYYKAFVRQNSVISRLTKLVVNIYCKLKDNR